MYRAVARVRTLIVLLLLLAGQGGTLASAQGATCPRAALRRSAAAAISTTTVSGSVDARVSDHSDRSSAPMGDVPAAPSATCAPAIALPERAVECLLPIPPVAAALTRVTSPPGDPFAVSFFRPPRPS